MFFSGGKAAHPLEKRLEQRQIKKRRNIFPEGHQVALIIMSGRHAERIKQEGPVAQGGVRSFSPFSGRSFLHSVT